jgi:hypothetical protein
VLSPLQFTGDCAYAQLAAAAASSRMRDICFLFSPKKKQIFSGVQPASECQWKKKVRWPGTF